VIVTHLHNLFGYFLSHLPFELIHTLVKHVINIYVQVSAHSQCPLSELFRFFIRYALVVLSYLKRYGEGRVRASCHPRDASPHAHMGL